MLTVFPALARRPVLQKRMRRSARPVRLHRETDNRCFAGVWAYMLDKGLARVRSACSADNLAIGPTGLRSLLSSFDQA